MNDTTRHTRIATVLGDLLLVASDDRLVGLYFPGHWRPPAAEALGAQVTVDDDPLLTTAATQVHEYLDGTRTAFDVPLATTGDEFSERVWALLRDIPYGETTTYGRIAHQLGARELAQLVGRAVGGNPISIVIPCHRVLGADGALTGYAGGLRRKRHLLDLEQLPLGACLF
jgi:methylated-DNA-[protein]-cysteine S-methyltransferase